MGQRPTVKPGKVNLQLKKSLNAADIGKVELLLEQAISELSQCGEKLAYLAKIIYK